MHKKLQWSTFNHIIIYSNSLRSSLYYFLIFITSSSSFHGFITNQFNDLLPVGLLAHLERVLHRYCRGQGFESRTSLNFFSLSFRNCKSCISNCNDLLLYNSSPQSSRIRFSYIHNLIIIFFIITMPLKLVLCSKGVGKKDMALWRD